MGDSSPGGLDRMHADVRACTRIAAQERELCHRKSRRPLGATESNGWIARLGSSTVASARGRRARTFITHLGAPDEDSVFAQAIRVDARRDRALILAASGTAVAAGRLLNGDNVIKPRTLSGNKLRNHTITGTQVKP
jgi:hypothetical protein